jgi:hypothetical protein
MPFFNYLLLLKLVHTPLRFSKAGIFSWDEKGLRIYLSCFGLVLNTKSRRTPISLLANDSLVVDWESGEVSEPWLFEQGNFLKLF